MTGSLEKLIKALTILLKYGNPACPTHCEHDVLRVSIDPNIVSDADKMMLNKLHFYPDDEFPVFKSHWYGSA